MGSRFHSPSQKRGTFCRMARSRSVSPSTPGRSTKHTALGMPYDTAGDAIISSEIELHNLAAQMWTFVPSLKLAGTSPVVQIDAWERIPLTLGFRPKCYIVSGRVRFLFKHEHDEFQLQIHEIWRAKYSGEKLQVGKKKVAPIYIVVKFLEKQTFFKQKNWRKNKVSFGTPKHLLRRKGVLGGCQTSTNPRYCWWTKSG